MRFIALLALAACTTAAAPPPQACPPSMPPPLTGLAGQIAVVAATYDVGEILRGETVSHTFELTNQGNSDVTLFEVRACCTCATAAMTIDKRRMTAEDTAACKLLGTLKPKEHAALTLTVDTLDDGCGGKDGFISKSVRVYFSDRSTSPLTLSIAGVLVTPYALEPAGLCFGTVKQGQGATASCIVRGTKLGNFEVSRLQPSSDFVKTVVEKVPESSTAPAAIRVSGEVLPDAPIANYQGRVVLKLDHPRVRAIIIPLSVVIEPPSGKSGGAP